MLKNTAYKRHEKRWDAGQSVIHDMLCFFLTNYLNKHSNIKRLILSLEVVEGYRSFLTAQKEVGPEYFHSGQTRVDL